MPHTERGTTMLVFDAGAWGGRDVGSNEKFWRPATILTTRGSGRDATASIRWHHDERISHGHFLHAMRAASTEEALDA